MTCGYAQYLPDTIPNSHITDYGSFHVIIDEQHVEYRIVIECHHWLNHHPLMTAYLVIPERHPIHSFIRGYTPLQHRDDQDYHDALIQSLRMLLHVDNIDNVSGTALVFDGSIYTQEELYDEIWEIMMYLQCLDPALQL